MLNNIFDSKKSIEILIHLLENENVYSKDLSYKTRSEFAHVHKLIKQLNNIGLVEIGEKTGRIRYLTLTEKGKIVSRKFREINDVLS